MPDFYTCRDCSRAWPLLDGAEKRCTTCNSTNGFVSPQEHVMKGLEVGAYWNIDPKTGKTAKKKRR